MNADIENAHLMCKSEQHILIPKHNILCSFLPLEKHCHVTYLGDDNKSFKITCKHCNGYLRCACRSGELNFYM